jgi:hypothetical protein
MIAFRRKSRLVVAYLVPGTARIGFVDYALLSNTNTMKAGLEAGFRALRVAVVGSAKSLPITIVTPACAGVPFWGGYTI